MNASNDVRKIIFFGDSNTWGYDPRSFFGERYPEDRIWTSLVSEALQSEFPGAFEVVNQGMNGRMLPHSEYDFHHVDLILKGMCERDLFVMMLGTNDILLTMQPDAKVPVRRMEQFLSWFTKRNAGPGLLILAAPYADPDQTGDPAFTAFSVENKKMNAGFEMLCEQYDVPFADTSRWDIEFAFDMVHFSEEGHQAFAAHMAGLLKEIITNAL